MNIISPPLIKLLCINIFTASVYGMPRLHILHVTHVKDWSATGRVLFIFMCMQFRFIWARAVTLGLKQKYMPMPLLQLRQDLTILVRYIALLKCMLIILFFDAAVVV